MSSMSLCFVNTYWFTCFRQVWTGTTKAWDCCGRFKNTWLELPTLKKLKCVTSKDKRQRWADDHHLSVSTHCSSLHLQIQIRARCNPCITNFQKHQSLARSEWIWDGRHKVSFGLKSFTCFGKSWMLCFSD